MLILARRSLKEIGCELPETRIFGRQNKGGVKAFTKVPVFTDFWVLSGKTDVGVSGASSL